MEENSQHLLNIYKASAGSGKTYRLTIEFLKYIIQDPSSFERVLAVTFTNKATAEMKTKIIVSLYGIANNLPEKQTQSDITLISDELGKIDRKFLVRDLIVANAKTALSLMLHNYSKFHIETIDSFFQTVLRNFEKELGLGTHLNIELDSDAVLSEATAALLDNITVDKKLCKWVSQFLIEKLDNGSSSNIEKEINNFGKYLFSEEFKKKSPALFNLLKSDSSSESDSKINHYRQKLVDVRSGLVDEILESAARFDRLYILYEWKNEDFYYKDKGVPSYFKKILNCDFSQTFNSYVLQVVNGEKDPGNNVSVNSHKDEILQILDETEKIRSANYLMINTIDLINANLFHVGLLHYLENLVRTINQEKNQFILSDTQALLNSMVADSDAPFIYEKIGTSLDHIMIDEFQDTSETQWANFKPLISECASRNMSNLVVGDQKQSIYRFRNGKWQLLGNLADEMAHINSQVVPLNTNWRSESRIVEFNNMVFKYAPDLYRNVDHPLLDSMIDAYADASQISRMGEVVDLGYVKVQFFENSSDDDGDYQEKTLRALADEVKSMQMKGIRPEQITILVRKTSLIQDIAEYFGEYKQIEGNDEFCFDLISEEAYMLETSESIQCIISAMRYIALLNGDIMDDRTRKKNRLAITQLLHAYAKIDSFDQEMTPPNPDNLSDEQSKFIASIAKLGILPLYEMVEEIYRVMRLERIPHQENYFCFFLDRVNEFITKKSSDLRLFLVYWDDFLHNRSIPSGEANGIRIMTIHKSKGLEFHSVLVPFCDWDRGLSSSSQKRPILWEDTKNLVTPLCEFPLVAVKASKKMAESYFAESLERETIEAYMDNLNLLYVALTRAKKNMVIFGKKKSEGSKNKKNDNANENSLISYVLFDVLKNHGNECWHDDEALYLFGKLLDDETEQAAKRPTGNDAENDKEAVSKNPFKRSAKKYPFVCVNYQQKGQFRQSNKSNDFIEDIDSSSDSEHNEYIDRGKLLHYLFSKITTYNDVDSVVEQMDFEGLFESDEQKNNILDSMHRVMATEKAQKWFCPGLTLYNECSILFRDENGELQVRRPDRVIRDGNNMMVIDFKFGKERTKHVEQINEYVNLLCRMGYNAKGDIWYLNDFFSRN